MQETRRWAAVLSREETLDDSFIYAVKSTKIYCRPGCLSRRPIPYGSTASYAEIAELVGTPGAVRAVARACAWNRIAVVIPYHRVVRKDGSVSGYRWSVDRKTQLLASE